MRADLRITVVERNIDYFDLYTADEVFVTGTAAEVGPIVAIGAKLESGTAGRADRRGS